MTAQPAEAPDAADAPDAVNLDHLGRYTGGERTLNEEVLRLFESQCADLSSNLNGAVTAADAKAWRLITHTLKGAARGIGADALADAAADAEKIDITDRAALQAAAARIGARIAEVRLFIARFVS